MNLLISLCQSNTALLQHCTLMDGKMIINYIRMSSLLFQVKKVDDKMLEVAEQVSVTEIEVKSV